MHSLFRDRLFELSRFCSMKALSISEDSVNMSRVDSSLDAEAVARQKSDHRLALNILLAVLFNFSQRKILETPAKTKSECAVNAGLQIFFRLVLLVARDIFFWRRRFARGLQGLSSWPIQCMQGIIL